MNDQEKNKVFKEFVSMWTFDHPDVLALRFLRARSWKVADGLKMYVDALKWRVEMDVAKVVAEGESLCDKNDVEGGKSYFWKQDKNGRPCWYLQHSTALT